MRCGQPMTDRMSAAILATVQANLEGLFAKGVLTDVTAEDQATEYLAKASATNDPALAAGYRKLAKRARKVPQ